MAFGIDPNTPYNITGASLEQTIIQQMFGNGPLASMIAQFGTPYINRMLGLEGPGYRNTFLDTTLLTNMTPFGSYQDNLNNQINRIANTALTRQNNAARRNWLQNIQKTKMSFDSWRQTAAAKGYTDEQAQEAYDAYIANAAAGDMSNPLWGMAYNAIDPEGLNAANQYLQQAAANQIRFGSNKGSRTAMLQGRAIGNLFLNDKGEFTYDKAKYGYMTAGEASAVAAALTKDKDFFRGVDLKSGDMKKAAEDLQKAVQDYTNAMAPLKDVFGSDIPEMIRTVEGLTGKRLANINPEQLKDTVSRVMASAAVGGYDVRAVMGLSGQLRNNMMGMNVPFTNELSAERQAMTILNTVVNGYAPAFMSDDRYRRNIEQWVQRTSNSTGSGYLNAAAAVWLDQNSGKTLEDFKTAYDTMRTQYGATEAMMQMTGAGSLYQLETMGRQSANFERVTKADLGGEVARTENLNDLIAAGWRKSTNREAYSSAIAKIRENTELWTDSAVLEASNLTPEEKAQIRDLKAGMGMGRVGEALASGLTFEAENKRNQPMIARQMKLRDAMTALNEWLPDSLGGFVNDILNGKNVDQLIQRDAKLKIQEEETQKTLKTVISATRTEAMARGLLDRNGNVVDEKAYNDLLTTNLKHGLLNASTNQIYMDELLAYEDADQSTEEGRAAAASHAYRMDIARNVDEARLKEVIGSDGSGWGRVQEVWRTALDFADSRDLTREESEAYATQEVQDYMNYKDIIGIIDKSKIITDAHKETIGNILGYASTGEWSMDKAKEDLAKAGLSQQELDIANAAVNQVFNKEVSSESKMEDLFGKIGELLSKVGDLTGKLDKVITVDGDKAALNMNINHTVFGIGS